MWLMDLHYVPDGGFICTHQASAVCNHDQAGLGLLLLMSCDFRNRRRQLVVHADPPLLDAVVAHLRDALELTPMTGGGGGDDPALKAYEQGAYAISRKALMPILRKLEASAL